MRTLVAGDDRCVADQRVVNPGIGYKIGLELVQIDIERTIKAKTGCNRADDLGDQAVEMFEIRARNV